MAGSVARAQGRWQTDCRKTSSDGRGRLGKSASWPLRTSVIGQIRHSESLSNGRPCGRSQTRSTGVIKFNAGSPMRGQCPAAAAAVFIPLLRGPGAEDLLATLRVEREEDVVQTFRECRMIKERFFKYRVRK